MDYSLEREGWQHGLIKLSERLHQAAPEAALPAASGAVRICVSEPTGLLFCPLRQEEHFPNMLPLESRCLVGDTDRHDFRCVGCSARGPAEGQGLRLGSWSFPGGMTPELSSAGVDGGRCGQQPGL